MTRAFIQLDPHDPVRIVPIGTGPHAAMTLGGQKVYLTRSQVRTLWSEANAVLREESARSECRYCEFCSHNGADTCAVCGRSVQATGVQS